MASRCINALNELDAISDKVFYKYSKNRLKQDIERKVRESKSRAEQSSTSTSRAEKCPSRKSFHSVRSSLHSTATKKNSTNSIKSTTGKSTPTPVINASKGSTPTNQNNTKDKSNIKVKRTSSENTTISKTSTKQEERNTVVKSPSVFGKYTPGAPKYRNGKWFNFEDGVNHGVIDSFACDNLNERALCYKVDAKESKSVPKLLRHRLEVRIGQNGEVRTQDAGVRQDSQSAQSKNVRTAPLSWEEQLNWENTSIKRPRSPQPPTNETEGLCETHPVIYNPETNYPRLSNTTVISNEATMSYRLYMDKKLVSDRRNLTCGLKCVTSVELEESASNTPKADMKESISRTKSVDSDLMDMSSTIQNIGKIYRTYSEELTKKLNTDMQEGKEENQDNTSVGDIAKQQENSESTETNKQEFEKVKINKRVSFRDEVDSGKVFESKTPKDVNVSVIKENSSKEVKRPSSSKARSFSLNVDDFKIERPRRPCTAPPCSPRTTLELQDETKVEEPLPTPKQLLPIWVPTSNEIHSETENELKDDKTDPKPHSQEIQVKFTCKSAPTVRSTNLQDTETLARSQSTMSTRVKTEKYVPPKPVAILDDSEPLELPSNMPPGQAVIELRKKIRENLAKETAGLQLDIQQLYLKHHSYNN